MPGTIFRLPDDTGLQRGITYTILPDGKMIQVPSMSRMMVRAASSSHDENDEQSIAKALKSLLEGKKEEHKGRRRPGVQREGTAQRGNVPLSGLDARGGLRPAVVEEA